MASEAKEKEEQKAKKAEEKAQKAKKQASSKSGPKTRARQEESRKSVDVRVGTSDNIEGESVVEPSSSTSTQKRRTPSLLQTVSKRQCLEEIDTSDRCCVCFQAFEEDVLQATGVDWVQCSCTHWLHEDCVLDCITDSSGKERLCPYCT